MVQVIPDSSTCIKCGLGPILDKDWRGHLKECQGIDLPDATLSVGPAVNGGAVTATGGGIVSGAVGPMYQPPPRKSSACPTCTPRCPHGYPADAQPFVTYPPVFTYPITHSTGTPLLPSITVSNFTNN